MGCANFYVMFYSVAPKWENKCFYYYFYYKFPLLSADEQLRHLYIISQSVFLLKFHEEDLIMFRFNFISFGCWY